MRISDWSSDVCSSDLFLRPKPALRSWVLAFDLNGKRVHDLQYGGDPVDSDAPKPYGPITSVREIGGTLYFGSLSDTAIGRLVLPTTEVNAAAPRTERKSDVSGKRVSGTVRLGG